MSTIDTGKHVGKNHQDRAFQHRKNEGGFDKSTLPDQHRAIKAWYPSALLLFHIGENYEAYGDDAFDLHTALGLRLATHVHALDIMRHQVRFEAAELDNHLARLVSAGHKVAVCDQLGDHPTLTPHRKTPRPPSASTRP